MLDQVSLPALVARGVSQQPSYNVKLVITREDLFPLLSAGLLVFPLNNLCVVLQNVGEPLRREHTFPEIIGFESFWIGRVARAVIPALIEGQEPRALTLEVGAHAHLVVIHGKMHDAAPELKEQFAWVAVAFVLLHRIFDGLLGQAILQLEGGNGQPVDEKAEVKRELCFIAAVA